MTEVDNELSERLLLLIGLLEFNRKEESFQYMERVLKLAEPDFRDVSVSYTHLRAHET